MTMSRLVSVWTVVLLSIASAACDGRVYTRDGVTDGDTFYLAEYAYYDPDPVLQAWVAYSLDLSHCQLRIGGFNPARNTSLACELGARHMLLDRYAELGTEEHIEDPYLIKLEQVRQAGYLDEYLVEYFHHSSWDIPTDLTIKEFKTWRRDRLKGHKPQRRIIGSWNFREAEALPDEL